MHVLTQSCLCVCSDSSGLLVQLHISAVVAGLLHLQGKLLMACSELTAGTVGSVLCADEFRTSRIWNH